MNWLKCDLQMQTPADSLHWLGDQMVPGSEQQAAQSFAEACYEKRLDVVGITDHNFLGKDFLPLLKVAFGQIFDMHGHRITMFPGFEFEAAGVGRGVHVLCLFNPDDDLTLLDSILTECGVGYPRVNPNNTLLKSDKNLKSILKIIQDRHGGIVILPHTMSNDGLFDNESVSEWLQMDQFINPDLLAVEVPKPVDQMSDGFKKLFHSGEDCLPEWKRIRSIATIMSSDNKMLIETDSNGRPVPNSIGYRYSWIKMSDPSIESLRQAFLDHESRVILPEDVLADVSPSNRIKQSHIQSIHIRNVSFLANQDIYFSPNMNCIIGGRGSGKSTLLEYLRIMLGKDNAEDLDPWTKKRIERVRETLNTSGAELKVCWKSSEGLEDSTVWRDGFLHVSDSDLPDQDTFFRNLPLSFYSQQELNRLTDSKSDGDKVRSTQPLLKLIDGFSKKELDDLSDQERKLNLQIREAFEKLRKARTLDKDIKRLQQEHQELDRQWKAQSEIQEDAHKHQLLKLENRYIEGLLGTPGKQFSDVAKLAEVVANSHLSFEVEDSPHGEWFRQFNEKVKAEKNRLAETIRAAVDQFYRTIEALKAADQAWTNIKADLDKADEKFNEACTAKGLTPDDVGRLQEINLLRSKKQKEIDEISTESHRLKEEAGDVEALIQKLYQIWKEQYRCRTEAAERANQLATLYEGNRRFVEVSVRYQQYRNDFMEKWQSIAPNDGRTRLGRSWETAGETLYDIFSQNTSAESPWQLLQDRLSSSAFIDGGKFGEIWEDLSHYLQSNQEKWETLRCSRVQDSVDIKLFRSDGTTAGSISEGSLSDGQRNTAVLALILSQDGGPLIIDQPEDELDSNFVFRELIPMLRKVKSKRQLIISTHNANLPVNGDSELVYALEANGGHGTELAQGGLDRINVTKAILDIMEGSEEAFRRRREKYHF